MAILSSITAPSRPRTERGFTLIELLVALAVLALVMAFIVHSFGGLLARQRLKASAENFYDTLQLARTESINRNQDMFVSVTSGTSWCYGMDDTTSCNCAAAGDCQVDSIEKVIAAEEYKNVQISAATFAGGAADNFFVFNPRRGMPEDNAGTLRNGSVTFLNDEGDSLTVQVSAVGRITVCTATDFLGYSAC